MSPMNFVTPNSKSVWTHRLLKTAALLALSLLMLWRWTGSHAESAATIAPLTWNPAPPMTDGRYIPASSLLPSGKVLVAGGFRGQSGSFSTTVNIFDPTGAGSWTVAKPLPRAHRRTALLLNTGDVLVVGDDDNSDTMPSSFLYNEAANDWTVTANTPSIRRHSTALATLPNGRVMMIAGYNGGCCNGPSATYNTCEFYDPATKLWSAAPPLNTTRTNHTATTLPNGNVLVTGGAQRDPLTMRNSTEIFNPSTNAWTPGATLTVARYSHTATLLPDGRVLVIGGSNNTAVLNSVEIYNTNGTWSPAAPLSVARHLHTATLLPSGKVLVVGGVNFNDVALNSAELYDPATNTWENAGPLGGPRGKHIAEPLPCGRVLIAAGAGANAVDLATAEIFTQFEAVHTISPMTLSNGVTGTTYSATFTATGGMAPYTFSVFNGPLPNGLTLNPNGTLSGTPSASGNFPFTIAVTDKNGCTTQKRYVVNIACTTLTLTPIPLPNGTAGTPYGQSLTTTGGTAPYSYMLSSGDLPPGLTLSSGGQLAGTPTRCGSYAFSLKVTDRYGCMVTREFVMNIATNIQITPMTLTPVQQGLAFTQTLTASGGCGAYSFSSTNLPTWLTLTSQGVLSGTPPQAGTFPLGVVVTDSCGCLARKNFDIVVTQGCATVTKPTTYRGGRMDNYARPIDASTRSPQLNAAFPNANWQGYDTASENHFVGQSFYFGCRTIVRAELEIHMKPLTSITDNDTIYFGLLNAAGNFAWSQRIFALPGAGGQWDSATHPNGKLFIFDLANLPMGQPGVTVTNLLSKMNADGRLDILVQDDTSVDYIKLRVWCCPGRRFFDGYPYDVIGQAEAIPTANGALSLRNFGASGQDGATLELGATDGWRATVDMSNPPPPVGSELLLRTNALTETGEETLTSLRTTVRETDTQLVLEFPTNTPPNNTPPVQVVYYNAAGQLLGNGVESGPVAIVIKENGVNFTIAAKCCKNDLRDQIVTDITFGTPQEVTTKTGRKIPGVTRLFAKVIEKSIQAIKHKPTNMRVTGKGVRQVDLSKLATQMPDSRFFTQALGNATIEPFPGGVAVANLGASGADGVNVGLGRANSANFGLDALDPLDLAPDGAYLEANVLGIVSGMPNRSLGTFRMTKKANLLPPPPDRLVQLEANFSTIGSTTHRVQVFNGTTMVADLPGRSGQLVGTSSNWPRKLGKIGGQLECYTSDYPSGTVFTIGAQSYTGNNLRVLAELPAASFAPDQNRIEAKTDFILRGSGLGEFILTESDAEPVCAGGATITPASLPEAFQNAPYTAIVSATGGQVPYLYDVTGLPAGLDLLPGGAFVGKATQTGTFNLAFTITDDNGCTTTRSYALTVRATTAAASVSAASYRGPSLAADEIVAAFGVNLATETVVARTTPLPTELAGTSVKIFDSTFVEHAAPLFFVSAGQVNYLVPAAVALGEATVVITSGNGAVSTQTLNIARTAPGLFSQTANGRGPAAAYLVRVRNGVVTSESSVRFDTATNQYVLIPIDLGGESEQVFLVAFGTGARGRSALANVAAKVGGLDTRVDYAGAQGGLAGLDQFNLLLPRSLAGRGVVDVVLTVDGQTTNTVQISIK